MELTVYIKPWCPWCVDALEWFANKGYKVKPVDVLTDSAGYARMRKISGQSLTPTLETEDGKVLADFDVRQLEKFLQENNIGPA